MPRILVVERESGALVTDRMDPGDSLEPTGGGGGNCLAWSRVFAIHRTQRILRQQVLHVGQHQLLMLLLMIEPQLDDGGRETTGVQQPRHGGIHVSAVLEDLGNRGTRQQTTMWAIPLWPERVVIRVEEILELRVERPIALRALKNER